MNNNIYFENNIQRLQAYSVTVIRKMELGTASDKFDFINSAFLKLNEVNFNSEDHFLGSCFKYIKLMAYSEKRKCLRQTKLKNYSFNYQTIEQQENDYLSHNLNEIITESIESETNPKHKLILNLLADGLCYDTIAHISGIDRKNIRFHMFEAKRKLKEKLILKGISVEQGKKIASFYNINKMMQNATLYDAFPFEDKSIKTSILWTINTINRKISRKELTIIIAKKPQPKL